MSAGVLDLGPMWVASLQAEMQKRRDAAFDRVQRCKPDGDYRKQGEMLLAVYDAMLAGPELLEALRRLLDDGDEHLTPQGRKNLARAAIAKATGSTP